jgi:transcriptional regulator with XRE-family HTH domain
VTSTPILSTWTGRESSLLRQAMRLSVRAFAEHLGMSTRMVSQWEARGSTVSPRPDTQAVLDTALTRSSPQVRERFEHLLRTSDQAGVAPLSDPAPRRPSEDLVTVAPQITHAVDDKIMVAVPRVIDSLVPSTVGDKPQFFIDLLPVTNDDYLRFVSVTEHPVPKHWIAGRPPARLLDHPVTMVTHGDASRYAAWAGKALPSVLEWEAAAQGPHGHIYPWGDRPTAMKCNVSETGIGATTPVTRYHSGTSYYGVYDLTGNVWEWCRTHTGYRRFALKGSAFTSPLAMGAIAQTNDADAAMLDDDTGFRCVWAAATA